MRKLLCASLVIMVLTILSVTSVSALGKDSGNITVDKIVSSDKRGDIDLNDLINSEDLCILKKCLLGVDTKEVVLLDVNTDTNVDVRDLINLEKIIVQQ